MEITDELFEKLANLARLGFSPQEREAVRADLQKMVTFVEKLQELDTSGVRPLIHMSPAHNSWRNDSIAGQADKQASLAAAPGHDTDYFLVPKVLNTKS